MQKVVFVNRYFHPDHSATSQIASDLAFHLASRGWEVAAITSRQRYDDARANLAASETANGVRIERVWSTRFGRGGLIGRAVDYATFYLSAYFAIRRIGSSVPRSLGSSGEIETLDDRGTEQPRDRGTVVVAMTDPPLLSVIAALASKRVVNWTQDLFPEVAQSLGIRVPGFVRRLRDWSLRRARVNVVLGELMAGRVPNAVVIHNWAAMKDGGRPVRQAGETPALQVGYSGNLGRAHEVETIIGAIRALPGVRFVFTGGGARLDEVRRIAAPNVEIRPYVSREQLGESLSSADVHLVSLQPALEGLIVPSKFYGVLAVGRPVIFIGARDGELARIIEAHRCGIVVEAGDVDELVRAIQRLATDRAEAEAMGQRGRELYLARFAPQHAFAAWERVLENALR